MRDDHFLICVQSESKQTLFLQERKEKKGREGGREGGGREGGRKEGRKGGREEGKKEFPNPGVQKRRQVITIFVNPYVKSNDSYAFCEPGRPKSDDSHAFRGVGPPKNERFRVLRSHLSGILFEIIRKAVSGSVVCL